MLFSWPAVPGDLVYLKASAISVLRSCSELVSDVARGTGFGQLIVTLGGAG